MTSNVSVAHLRGTLKSVQDVIQKLRKLSPVMSIGEMEMLLAVALQEGLSQVEYMKLTNNKLPTANRYLMNLSDKLRTGEKGMGLVFRDKDPQDYRRNVYTLTKKGRDLVSLLARSGATEE